MAVSSEPLTLPAGVGATGQQVGRRRAATPWTSVRRRFVRSGTGMAGLVVLIAVILAAVFAGQVAPYNPIKQDFRIERQALRRHCRRGPRRPASRWWRGWCWAWSQRITAAAPTT